MKATATRLALAAAIATGVSGAAQSATFVDDVANFNLTGVGVGTLINSNPVIVDPGVEATVTGNASATLNADIGASTLTIFYNLTSLAAVGFTTVWTISGLETTDVASTITGMTLSSGNAALVSDFSFTANSLSVTITDIATATFGANNAWVFNIETTPVGAAVPLPAGLPLVLTGLAALGLVRRARRAA